MFRECGYFSYGISMLGALSFVAAAVALLVNLRRDRGARPVAIAAAVVPLLTLAAGGAGTMTGRRVVDKVLGPNGPLIDPARVVELREMGYAEAFQCTRLALAFAAIPLLLGLVALGLSLRGPRAPAA